MNVLCYHGVDPDWESPLAVDPAAFDRQCHWLARSHGTSADPDVRRRKPVLTFDDGFVSVYHHALPILRRHRLPATVFIVAGTLHKEPVRVDWVRPPGDYLPLTMTIDQILELIDAGISIGSHSWSHRELPSLSEAECLADLRDSRELLEDLLGAPVPLFAYPFGLHAEHVRRAAQRAGYTHAYALPEGPEQAGPYAVPRVGVYRGNSLSTVKLKASRVYAAARLSRTYARLHSTTSS